MNYKFSFNKQKRTIRVNDGKSIYIATFSNKDEFESVYSQCSNFADFFEGNPGLFKKIK